MICLEGIAIRSKSATPGTFHGDTIGAKPGAAEIGIDPLLAALDRSSRLEGELVASLFEQVPKKGGGFFHNTGWMRLANGVVAAITPIGGFEDIANVEVLRNALIEARKRGER
jgi:hypothetical protein